MKQWFRIDASADPTVAEIHIIDFIGDWFDDAMNRIFGESIGVTARAFVDALAKLPEAVKTIHVHINSPGGDVEGAVNIANALRAQQTKGRTVNTIVDGLAASAASIVAMAGSKVSMADNALMMIHNPWTIGIGNAAEMRKTASVLDTIRTQIINTYQWHSELSTDEIAALMDAETWMDADEAVSKGFATAKIEGLAAAASITPKTIAKLKIPEKFQARVQTFVQPPTAAPQSADAAEVLRLCKAAECLDLAEGFINGKASLATVEAALASERTTRTAARQRTADVAALCSSGKLDSLAGQLAASNLTLEAIGALVTTVKALRNSAEIDTGLHPDQIKASTTDSWKRATDRVNRGRRSPFGARQ